MHTINKWVVWRTYMIIENIRKRTGPIKVVGTRLLYTDVPLKMDKNLKCSLRNCFSWA